MSVGPFVKTLERKDGFLTYTESKCYLNVNITHIYQNKTSYVFRIKTVDKNKSILCSIHLRVVEKFNKMWYILKNYYAECRPVLPTLLLFITQMNMFL
jgi:hypothetical protein